MGELRRCMSALLAIAISVASLEVHPAMAMRAEGAPWSPQDGPQTEFASCEADICIFGGGAGGGKSTGLLYEPVKWTGHPLVHGFKGILLRRTSPQLFGSGGLWDESQELYRACGGRPRAMPYLDWTFEAASGEIGDRHRIEFGHLVREDTVYDHQGLQYAYVGFDELTHFTEHQFWYMVSRLRSTSGVKPYVRATCNPDPDSFVADLIAWWIGPDGYAIPERSGRLRWVVRRDGKNEWYDTEAEAEAAVRWFVFLPTQMGAGESATLFAEEVDTSEKIEARRRAASGTPTRAARAATAEHWFATKAEAEAFAAEYNDPDIFAQADVQPLSVTFILARLRDNAILSTKDPSYRGKLTAMGRVDRERLLGDETRGGNWSVRESAGMFFRRDDFVRADAPPSPISRTVRAWDKGASEPTRQHPDPDPTRGVRVSLCEGGEIWIDALETAQVRPVDVLKRLRSTAESDGVGVAVAIWQDTGGAGKTDADLTVDALTGFVVEVRDSFGADTAGVGPVSSGSSRAKRAFAKVWAPLVERRRVYVSSRIFDEIAAECDAFPEGKHDDIVDAISLAIQVLVGQGNAFWDGFRVAVENMRRAKEGSPLTRAVRAALEAAHRGERIALVPASAKALQAELRAHRDVAEKAVAKTPRGGLRFRKGVLEFFEDESRARAWVRLFSGRVMRVEGAKP